MRFSLIGDTIGMVRGGAPIGRFIRQKSRGRCNDISRCGDPKIETMMRGAVGAYKQAAQTQDRAVGVRRGCGGTGEARDRSDG